MGNRGIMPTKNIISSFVIAGLMFGINSSAGANAASDSQDPPPLSAYVSDEQAQLDQVHELAKTLGMAESDVEIRLANEAQYTKLVDLSQADYSDSFAGSGVLDQLSRHVWLRFVGPVPSAIKNLASVSDLSVDFETEAKFSLKEVGLKQNRLVAALSRAGISNFMADVRQKPNMDLALMVYVNGDISSQKAASRAINQFENFKSSPSMIEVIQERSDFSTHSTAITGGGALNGPSGSCTAAFTVTKGNLAGVATANHCSAIGSSLFYQNNLSYFYEGNLATQGDAGWFMFPNTTAITNKIIYNSSGSVMSITSSGNPAVGTSVCRFGKTTGYKCGVIGTGSLCLTLGAGTSCNYATITPGTNDQGDSGGPVFSASKAVGTTTGNYTVSGNQIDIFTKISSLALLGLTVKTTP